MNDNTFWITFWIIVFTYFGITSYFDNKTKQIEVEANFEMEKLKSENEKQLRESLEKIINITRE